MGRGSLVTEDGDSDLLSFCYHLGVPICVPTPRTNTGTAGRYWEGLTDLGLGRAPHPASGRLVSIGLEGKHLTVRTHPHPALDHPGTRKAKWVWAGGS